VTTALHRDAWGIPHLRAPGALELARAQGLVTARDRAWQLEVERHRAQGTSASFLGPGALPWDLFARRARLADTARHPAEPNRGACGSRHVRGATLRPSWTCLCRRYGAPLRPGLRSWTDIGPQVLHARV
jgi:acyl-homoserine lactone acylase PvdQ